MRIAAALAVALLAACSSADVEPVSTPVAQCAPGAVLECPGGWSTCSSDGYRGGCVQGPRPTVDDAGAADAAPDAPACGLPNISTQVLGVDCEPVDAPCGGCTSGQRYRCTAPDYRAQPSTGIALGGAGIAGGCVTVLDVFTPPATYTVEHCCAAACVRRASSDGACSVDRPNAYACAVGVSPRVGCVAVGAGYCCEQ